MTVAVDSLAQGQIRIAAGQNGWDTYELDEYDEHVNGAGTSVAVWYTPKGRVSRAECYNTETEALLRDSVERATPNKVDAVIQWFEDLAPQEDSDDDGIITLSGKAIRESTGDGLLDVIAEQITNGKPRSVAAQAKPAKAEKPSPATDPLYALKLRLHDKAESIAVHADSFATWAAGEDRPQDGADPVNAAIRLAEKADELVVLAKRLVREQD